MTKKYSFVASVVSDSHRNVTTLVSSPKDAPSSGLTRLNWQGIGVGVTGGIGVGVVAVAVTVYEGNGVGVGV